MTAKIYLVTNKVNNKKYVGFTIQTIRRRWKSHIWMAMSGYKHSSSSNIYFYNAIRKYGPENFIIEQIYESEDINHTKNVMENFFILKYNTFWNCEEGYNSTLGGEGTIGYKRTPEQIEKIRKRTTGRKLSPKRIEEMRQYMKGNKYALGMKHSDETKKIISEKGKGRVVSEEARMKIGMAHRGKKLSPEQIKNMSLSRKGKPGTKHTEEYKKMMSEVLTGRVFSSETIEKMKKAQEKYEYILKNPYGETIATRSLTDFCSENNLPRSTLTRFFKKKEDIQEGRGLGWKIIEKKNI